MTEIIAKLLEEKNFAKLREIFSEEKPADLAIIFSEVPIEKLLLLFRILPKELAAETFVEMDSDMQKHLIETFTDAELEDVISELFLDDTVDIIEEMPANVVTKILANTDHESRTLINQILHYPKDSAGSIMTMEYVELKKHMTVQDAFTRIRRTGVDKETIYTCYITDPTKKLIGIVTAKSLMLSDADVLIEDIMETNIISVVTTEDKETAARLFDKYNFLSVPVVDNEHRLVGIITIDDALDVLQQENTEDIEKMAAILPTEKPYIRTGIFETWTKRVPWLMLLMISATFTSKILSHFEDALAAQVALTAFIPMLMDTGGNAGSQASVTIIRGLSLGDIELGDIFRILWKEFRVSFLCGITLAAVNFVKMLLIDNVSMAIAAVVCFTLIFTVIIAKMVGCSLPILAKKIGFDPAVMASPFITTIVDAFALLIYFKIASIIL